MKNITIDNILDQIVQNRTISRKEKQIAIQKFLKENSGKDISPEKLHILETLKNLKKDYLLRDKSEK